MDLQDILLSDLYKNRYFAPRAPCAIDVSGDLC